MQLVDLTGKKYGKWTIIGRVKTEKDKYRKWICRCKCGKEKILDSNYIRKIWKPTDCGCSNTIVGKKFSMLLVVEKLGKKCNTFSTFKCICDCGQEKVTRGAYLVNGQIKSCGCNFLHKAEIIGPKTVFNHYKQASKKRNFDFTLTKENVKKIIESECFYCGVLKSNTFCINKTKNHPQRYYSYNGIDRIDNEKGYILENCVACCNICNLMKRGMSIEEWINHMKNIFNHLKLAHNQEQLIAS